MKSSTDLENINKNGFYFTWGEVVEIISMKNYSFVVYHPWKSNECNVYMHDPDYTRFQYNGYIDGKSISRGWNSLEAAMVGIVAYKLDGPNTKADRYFMKMIRED